MRFFLSIFFFALIGLPLFGQDVVTVQVVDVDTKRGISGIKVELLNMGSGKTDDEGFVRIPIPPGTEKVELQPPKGFSIFSPPGPIGNVPNSEESWITFYLNIGVLKELQRQIRVLSSLQNTLESSLDSVRIQNGQLQNQMSSLASNADSLKSTNESQMALIDSLEQELIAVKGDIVQAKLDIYEDISNNYNSYLNAILNFTLGLQHAKLAFTNPAELAHLKERIDVLNEARDNMHEYYLGYLETVEQYWNKDLSKELEAVYDLALYETYEAVVLPLGEVLLDELRKAWNSQSPRIIAQKKAKKPTKEAKIRLDALNEQLQVQAQAVLAKLEKG